MTEFHADDYGLFLEQSERILACFEHGVLNGTSIISNGSELDACLQLLPEKGMQLSVHLTLMQGRCLAPVEEVPLLADGKGQFRVTFAQLLFSGFTGKRESCNSRSRRNIGPRSGSFCPCSDKPDRNFGSTDMRTGMWFRWPLMR